MKWREIQKAPVREPEEALEKQIKAQNTAHYLVLDLWKKGELYCRHAMDQETGEYGTCYPDGRKTTESLNTAAGCATGYWGIDISEKEWDLQKEDAEEIELGTINGNRWEKGYNRIISMEREYKREEYIRKTESKERRLRNLMDLCRKPGQKVYDWITEQIAGDLQYAFYDKQNKTYHCTACDQDIKEAAGGQWKSKEKVQCPLCGHELQVEKRKKEAVKKGRMTIIENMDDKRGAVRHFAVEIYWKERRTAILEEHIRLTMLRDGRYSCKLYYSDYWGIWSEGNRCNRRWKASYLYPDTDRIRAGLQGTQYQVWQDVLPMLAGLGLEIDYNGLLVESNRYWVGIAEYLAKGRFYRLLKEASEDISYVYGYKGDYLTVYGESLEGVLQIGDRQLINRLRQENGGISMLEWFQWSDLEEKKISQQCILWYDKNQISKNAYERSRASRHMTPEQLMNYITRQQQESYPGRKMKSVLEQYEDYLSMAEQLGKDMDDAMIYRPRELKRRHDEAVEEMNARREELERKRNAAEAARQAQKMREKYPGYEEILEEIRGKYEYRDDTYLIRVPREFSEITAEGMALHHCVGNTERYFDRIVSRETYICFLRQQAEPDKPYYTIEVEPGGTIRQHRGMYDEEPEIEKVKPFLRKWQKEIRKRMSREDHEYAKTSAILREKNMEELKQKKNTRVLNALIEDLMEVG